MISPDNKVKWQQPLSSIPDRHWDVAIIGAGPAGAIAAIRLAAAGHQVLLLDKEHFPREKVCGDGLLPDTLKCVDIAGIGDAVRKHGHSMRLATIFSPSRIQIDVPGTYLTLKRYLLDTLVAQRAVEVGAEFAWATVDRFAVDAEEAVSLTIRGSGKKYRARIAIVATGANVAMLKRMDGFSVPKPSAVAMRCYVQSSIDLDHLVVSYDKSIVPGYAWIFPMGNQEYNVGCGIAMRHVSKTATNLKALFHNFVNQFPLARKVMRNGSIAKPLRGGALRWDFEGVYPFTKGPMMLIGESIGTTLPLIFEGIGKAMETGKLAAEIVHGALASGDIGKLGDYNERLANEFRRRYKSYRIAQKWIAKPWLIDFIIRRAQKSVYIAEALSGIIAETHSPRDAFSLTGIVKSFWK
jgi:geranylgeranyl reductase family protein